MDTVLSPVTTTPTPNFTPNTTPAYHTPSWVKTIIGLLVVLIFLLSALLVGGGYYLYQLTLEKPVITPTEPSRVVETVVTPQPTTAPLQLTKSQDQNFEVSLDKVIVGEKIVTLNFTASNISDRMRTFVVNTEDLAKSYLTDDESSLKYEVVKDAEGKPLVSTIEYKWLNIGEKYAFYIQFTAPPKGSIVTINVPNLLPLVGVRIE